MTESRSAQQILIDWANKQQNWVRAIVREVLASRAPISIELLDRVYALSLAERELCADDVQQVPKLTIGSSTPAQAETLTVRKLYDVQNVNLLASAQEIEFNPGMTVLFGENATGKSGYVRIMKRLAAVRSKEEVLPDIRKIGAHPIPHAQIAYQIGNSEETLEWNVGDL